MTMRIEFIGPTEEAVYRLNDGISESSPFSTLERALANAIELVRKDGREVHLQTLDGKLAGRVYVFRRIPKGNRARARAP